MTSDNNSQDGTIDEQDNGGEGKETKVTADTVSIPRGEYDKMLQDLGSTKRELKDLRKSKEEAPETPKKSTEESALLQKIERLSLKTAGITHDEDIELARATAKKWGLDIDQVIADDDFKVKLERQQTARANAEATSGVKGGSGDGGAKDSTDYWKAKGHPPTPADVPDRKARTKIIKEMMRAGEDQGMYYNS